MKTVFTSADSVIHLYAQQTQQKAKCSNVFFEGKNLYSYGYHYLLCEFIDDKTVLIDDRGYSNTTSKHISIVRAATRQYKQFFKSETDLGRVYDAVIYNEHKLETARKPEIYTSEIYRLWTTLNEFINYTKKTALKKENKYKYVKRIFTTLAKEGGIELIAEARRKELKRIQASEAKKRKESLQKFMAYEINSFRIGKEDFLRVSQDGTEIQTTQGVRIPVKSAAVLYKMILEGKDIVGLDIEGYKVTGLNGHLVIGCHNINVDNMHKIGKQII